ncbi:hypothetical protein EYF80_013196 [Liparis tanakae]|uniref:Uncharacterized protein n=1 Tax=Liparis tanakae TaxID=230148 RepID=A0A4Z2IF12_9TELE|nr:hypothetical protein EYF80_013196 [Liparis tanakae]
MGSCNVRQHVNAAPCPGRCRQLSRRRGLNQKKSELLDASLRRWRVPSPEMCSAPDHMCRGFDFLSRLSGSGSGSRRAVV